MTYTLTLSQDHLALLNLAIAELPEKARFALSNTINAQLQEQVKKQAESDPAAMPKGSKPKG